MSGLITCIMPTRGRSEFARDAVGCFLAQTYSETELVVVDDVEDPSFPDGLDLAKVSYLRLPGRQTIGRKRNHAIEAGRGAYIAHFDDDDWSEPLRLEDQLARLESRPGRFDMTGYHSMRFRRFDTGEAWEYRGSAISCLGTSMFYRRSFWAAHRFPDSMTGEDTFLIGCAARQRRLISVPSRGLMWSGLHGKHTTPRDFIGVNTDAWRPCAT